MELKVLMNGLDAAGKTTILYKLKLGEVVVTIPTIGFNVENLSYKNFQITAWDLGGRSPTRALFQFYYDHTDAMIWVVDANDRDRLEVSEFWRSGGGGGGAAAASGHGRGRSYTTVTMPSIIQFS